ncbi:polyprotein [Pyrenophora tritici-repentis]|nr:polyprotein [Pyrenophora tritici-repentis]
MMKGYRPHLSKLPPPPSPNSLKPSHPFYDSFKKAEEEHLDSHKKTESWTEVPSFRARREGIQILDSMWVYTYKLDEQSRLKKCKARLVVRGDQQNNVTAQETYAATLTGRSFRMLMAIAARFGLELRGYARPGTILQLDKALYGLRISPLLWQKDITKHLTSMGFLPVPHEPCCIIRDGVFIFFYVDNIILGNHPNKRASADKAVEELRKKYTLTRGEPLKWFIGLEVIRDYKAQKVWLSQAAYIDKITRLVTDRTIRHDTPIAQIELLPRKDLATAAEINLYQRKIGSLLFVAVNTRPDVAFATSRLARFLTNPSTEHHRAADRVLLYLHHTRALGLQFGGNNDLVVASDASFADNTVDRKSSQGFILKLFRGAIAWRANKQDIVTTSTTEAELLSLAQAAKEAQFLVRLQTELGIKLEDSTITI